MLKEDNYEGTYYLMCYSQKNVITGESNTSPMYIYCLISTTIVHLTVCKKHAGERERWISHLVIVVSTLGSFGRTALASLGLARFSGAVVV